MPVLKRDKLDPAACRQANEALWNRHPELKRRQLTLSPEKKETDYRKEWKQLYDEAVNKTPKPPTPRVTPVANVPLPEPVVTGPVLSCPAVASMTHEQEDGPLVEDANVTETKIVQDAHKRAKEMIEKTIKNCLEKAKTQPCAAVKDYFGIDGTGPEDQEKLDTLLNNFKKMRSGMDKASYEVEHETIKPGEPYTVAYVYTLRLIHGVGDVHVCFPAFERSDDDGRAATLVHEMSHYAVGTEDNAYEWETTKWNKLTQEQKMDNADSYGRFARQCSTSADPCN